MVTLRRPPSPASLAAVSPSLLAFSTTGRLDRAATPREKVERLITLAQELHGCGRPQAAIGNLQRAIALAPELAEPYFHLADLYEAVGLNSRAKAMRARGQQLEQGAPVASTAAIATTVPGQPQPAGNLVTELTAQDPELPIVPLTPSQRQLLNESTQRLLVQLGEIGMLLAHTPGTGLQVTSEVRQDLKAALAASQEALREQRVAAAPTLVRATSHQVKSATGRLGELTQDLGPPGHAGVVSLGPQVAQLQGLLQQLGMELEVSGRYDAPTARAVRVLQSRHRLPHQNGMVDEHTRRLLRQLCGQTT